MMAIAFLGYVLPWGHMSFWGATVEELLWYSRFSRIDLGVILGSLSARFQSNLIYPHRESVLLIYNSNPALPC